MLKTELDYLLAASEIADSRGLFEPSVLQPKHGLYVFTRLEDAGYIRHKDHTGFFLTAAAYDVLRLQEEKNEQRAEAAAQRAKDRKMDAIVQGCIAIISAIVGALISMVTALLLG